MSLVVNSTTSTPLSIRLVKMVRGVSIMAGHASGSVGSAAPIRNKSNRFARQRQRAPAKFVPVKSFGIEGREQVCPAPPAAAPSAGGGGERRPFSCPARGKG